MILTFYDQAGHKKTGTIQRVAGSGLVVQCVSKNQKGEERREVHVVQAHQTEDEDAFWKKYEQLGGQGFTFEG